MDGDYKSCNHITTFLKKFMSLNSPHMEITLQFLHLLQIKGIIAFFDVDRRK